MPKTTKTKTKIKINPDKCKGCGLCVAYCPKGALGLEPGLNKKGVHPVKANGALCVFCGICALVCPDCGIEIDD